MARNENSVKSVGGHFVKVIEPGWDVKRAAGERFQNFVDSL